jgi:hypothetical protein
MRAARRIIAISSSDLTTRARSTTAEASTRMARGSPWAQALVLLHREEPAGLLHTDPLVAEPQPLNRLRRDGDGLLVVVDGGGAREPREFPRVRLLEAPQDEDRLLVGEQEAMVLVVARRLEAGQIADVFRAPDEKRIDAGTAHAAHHHVVASPVLGQ